ncbi:activator [Metarhizium rileyi]|uniref:Activator n=1 Tax=Metarhizium rileyi (strain RCEF 4871) TaxID=1649241 RepID=A0A162JFL4_METRR|nr:activator [Metarhizium rileyi RCEF 4871]
MPQKRGARGAASVANDTGDGGKPKKRRVSLACDACRAAREKCDGARPQCTTCIAQHRSCSYTPATKKRGVQTGYLRTVELSLAWLLEQVPECEEKLLRFLSGGDGDANKDTRALLGKGKTGHHLQSMWNKNRVRKAIDGLLSNAQTTNSEDSGNGSDTDCGRQAITRGATTPRSGEPVTMPRTVKDTGSCLDRILKLPANWERLLDVYVSYTHCWLPIVNLNTLRTLASTYPRQGFRWSSNVDDSFYPRHSELWAVMSIAAVQGEEYTESGGPNSLDTSQILDLSRALITPYEGVVDIHSINAIIIHAVILIGQAKPFAASLLLAKTVRLLQRLQRTKDAMTQEGDDFSSIQHDVVFLACALLDMLTSVVLCQRPMPECFDTRGNRQMSIIDFAGFDQPWDPEPHIWALSPTSTTPPQDIAQPIRTVVQLHAFASVLSNRSTSQMSGKPLLETLGPEHLVEVLDSRFNYCNSLISSGFTPMIPSAYLAKLLFLAATIELASDLRPSLFSGFLEIVESCLALFGAKHTPPLVVLLLQLVQRRANVDEMGESDLRKWRFVTEKMQAIWSESKSFADISNALPAHSSQGAQSHDSQQITFTPISTESDAYVDSQSRARSQPGGFGAKGLTETGSKPAEQLCFGNQNAVPDPAFAIDTPITTRPNNGRVNTHPIFPGNDRMSHNFDYDAILQDLGSIGYADNMEMDTRFMTNLGFAPGCDLAKIFQGDFGV